MINCGIAAARAVAVLAGLLLPGLTTLAEVERVGSETPSVLITGANRGIGLEFTRQFSELGWQVIATARNPQAATELRAIRSRHPGLAIEQLDITSQDQVDALAGRYRGRPIDVLINNAALLADIENQSLETLDFELFERTLAVNALGAMRVTRAFLPSVLASREKMVVTLSSAAASHGLLRLPAPLYAYRASKAALNMLMHVLALDLAERGVRVALLNPGLVDTRGVMALRDGEPVPEEFRALMPAIRSGQLVLISPEESVRGMIERIRTLTPEQSGLLINYDGQPLPW